MSDSTPIEWTDATWSPWEGCTKVSPGCDHCYAEGMNRWLRKAENWGPGAPRREYSNAHWQKPRRWNEHAAREGKRLRVFPSVCDPFDNEVAEDRRRDFFWLVQHTPHLDWLILTKRIGNAARMLASAGYARPLPNLWLGATVVNQEEADRDIPKLLATPARVRFLSIEPMLGPIDLKRIDMDGHSEIYPLTGTTGCEDDDGETAPDVPAIDWVIAGGESGRGARPAHPDWFRSLRDQCAAAGVPFLFKQWGEWMPVELPSDEECFAEDGSERQFEGRITRTRLEGHVDVARMGKKIAGRLLDGVTHDGFPEPL